MGPGNLCVLGGRFAALSRAGLSARLGLADMVAVANGPPDRAFPTARSRRAPAKA